MFEHVEKNPNYCDECKRINSMILTLCDDWRKQKEYNYWMDLFMRHDPKTHETAPPKTSHKGNGKHNGLFAGTLTISNEDDISEDEMCTAIKKIFSQKTCPVKKYAWYLEYTKAEKPHIHFIYETETGGRIHSKVFRRYWKTWDEHTKLGKGHRGGYHKEVQSEIAYQEYIAKDGGKSESKGFEITTTITNEVT